MAAVEEVVDDVFGDGVEAVIAGDEVVALAEDLPQFIFLIVVERGVFDGLIDFLVEVGFGDLEFRRAVLVEERHGGPVFDGLPEVINADVIAEDLAGAFLTGDQRRAGEGDELGVREGGTHVHGQRVVLAAMCLVGEDDDVVPF
jgi:hypothetical protein